ncbi:MAG: hypothetical protein P9M08_07605 [Candidatus Erginobacter occultus]|nr:hypothetical protein [Candidatus Erginobacter occultus]
MSVKLFKSPARTAICFLLLGGLLFAVFHSSFSNPPRSDWWALFYHFHLYEELPAFERALNIANYDVWGHGTYRPLFHLVLYWLYLLFGPNYYFYHLVAFGFYLLSVVLLYRLARVLGAGRGISLAGAAVFAVLFSHFDIVIWTFHLAVIAGFCLFLLGFLLYREYLVSGRAWLLALACLLFLPGLLCYEIFILWPAAVFILLFSGRIDAGGGEGFRDRFRASICWIGGLYLVYGAILAYTRSRSPLSGTAAGLEQFFSFSAIAFSSAVTAFSLVFNGVIANILPFLVSPVLIQQNIGLGGVYLRTSSYLHSLLAGRSAPNLNLLVEPPLVIPKTLDLDSLWRAVVPEINRFLSISGWLIILLFLAGVFLLWKRGCLRKPGPLLFTLFLLAASTFTLYHGRMSTNFPIYVLRQFRYQYISNALTVLLAVLLLDRLIRARPRCRRLVYLFLALIGGVNLLFLRTHLEIVNRQLTPLHRLLSEIQVGLDQGRIRPGETIEIDDTVVARLPPLCWNKDMAQFMRGTYQWLWRPGPGAAIAKDGPGRTEP